MLYILFFNILIFPVIYGSSNVSLASIEHDHNKNLSSKHATNEVPNKTKIPIISEGGSLLPEIPLLTSPKDNVTVNLLTIDEELAKTKEKPIQARKGVGNPVDDIVTLPKNISNSDIKVTTQNYTTENIKNNNHLNATGTSTTSKDNITPNNTLNTSGSSSAVKTEDTKKSGTPKKPLVLSYETLSNTDHKAQAKIPAMKSSSKTIIVDQMPSPNKDVRAHSDAFAHTGMVTPIVITILVVPMFALLGYMALRRGQEAWNNRHYKRVDFLLDGMYND